MLPLELPKIDFPNVSYRIVSSKTLAETDIQFSNSDQCIKHLKNYGYNSANTCELPPSYIRWIQPAEDELERGCEYDMDEQDLEWLQALNIDRKRLSQEPVTCELFEIVMDRLEKEWFRLSQRMHKPDPNMPTVEDSRCAICEDGDTENSNAIVFCDGCNLAVHQDCYGVPYIPEGQWLCRKCTVSPDRPVTCELCPNSFGAFKQTSENKWAHLICAIHIPETGVGNAMYMEPIDGVRCIPKQRWKLKCYICKTSDGACIQCANRSCCVAYHATCAQQAGLYVKMKPAGSLYPTNGSRGTDEGPESCSADHVGGEGVRLSQSFCDKHTPRGHIEALQAAAVVRLSTTLATTSKSNTNTKAADPQPSDPHLAIHSKKINSLDDLRALKLLAIGSQSSKSARAYYKTCSSGPPLVPEVIFQRVMQYSGKLRCAHKKAVINMICKYWSLKREVRRGAPLLKRLHLEPWTAASGTSSKNEEDRRRKYGLLTAVRHDLQQVKNLAAMICKREKMQLRKAEIQKEALEKTLFPVYQQMSLALTALIESDKQKYFLHPVSATDVPDYYDIIKHPMNWSTIQRKIDRFEYFRLSEFISDVHLTLTNARIYNHASSIYHKTAIRIGKAIEPLLKELIASEPSSAIAGLGSELFPTRPQKEHFAEITSVLLPDHISDLLDVHNLPDWTPRPYEEVLRDRNAKKSTQGQTSILSNLLSVPIHSQDQPIPSTEPPPAKFEPPSRSRSEGMAANPDVPSITNQPCISPPPRKLPNPRGRGRPRKRANSSTGDLQEPSNIMPSNQIAPTPAPISTPTVPSTGEELNLVGNETRNTQKSKRRRTSSALSDSTVDKPPKKAPRVKPQSQLEEEALIEKQNPNATRGQLISLKLRALHAKRIIERERNMSEAEKAQRLRFRNKIRLKRQKSRSQTATASQASPDASEACATPNEPETSLSREVSYPMSNDSQSNDNNLDGRASQASPELWKVADDDSEQRRNEPKSTNRASSDFNPECTVSSSSTSGSGTAMAYTNSRTSMQKQEEIATGIDGKSDDNHSLVTPTDPVKLGSCMINSEHSTSFANQDNDIQQIHNASRETTALPTTSSLMHTDTDELSPVKSADLIVSVSHAAASLESFVKANPVTHHSGTSGSSEMVCDEVDVDIAGNGGGSADNSVVPEHSVSSHPEAPAPDSPPQTSRHPTYSQDSLALLAPIPDSELERAVGQSGTSRIHLPGPTSIIDEQTIPVGEGATIPDINMSLDVPLPDDQVELFDPPLSSHEDIEEKIAEGDQTIPMAISSSANIAEAEDTHLTTRATSVSLDGTEVNELSAPLEVRLEVPPIQIASDELPHLNCHPDSSLVVHLSPSPKRPSTRSSKKLPPVQNKPAVRPTTQRSHLNPPIAQHTLDDSEVSANINSVQSGRKLKIRIKKMDSSAPIRNDQPGEALLPEIIPVSPSPKLRLILDGSSPNWGAVREAGSSITGETTAGQNDAARHEKEISKSKTTKSASSAGPPEFVTGLPGEKESFRLFNTGFILRNRTRRHTAGHMADQSDLKVRDNAHSQSPERQESISPRIKPRQTRVSTRLKPVRLTLLHNPPPNQESAQLNASNAISLGLSTDNQDHTSREPASPADDESGSSELSKPSSPSLEQASSGEGEMTNPSDLQISLEAPQEEIGIAIENEGSSEHPRNGQKASKTSKTAKRGRQTRAQQEKELEMDPRGFLIYPKAPHNGAKRVHPLARDAFTRMSQTTRLPEEGLIEDGTLVWAKVHGHPWFPAEVGLPDDPAVPQSMLDKQPTDGKIEQYVLVMFFDRQRSWQWVQRRNTRLLGESDELDALLSSEAYVSNKTQLEEIQNGCAFARANIEQSDDANAPELDVLETNQQPRSASSMDDDLGPSSERHNVDDSNIQDGAYEIPLNRMKGLSVGLKRTRSSRLRTSNPPLS
ncbi:hypothetical protein PtB15_2B610 [Puccinia triticina]|nr:hypothetical protein PtB15_2B610 [Puccinia triticina]